MLVHVVISTWVLGIFLNNEAPVGRGQGLQVDLRHLQLGQAWQPQGPRQLLSRNGKVTGASNGANQKMGEKKQLSSRYGMLF